MIISWLLQTPDAAACDVILGKFDMRLKDIVVATANGPLPMNTVSHDLVVLA
jgi:hypothetical protein